jgi:hypothetical protein
MKLPTPGPAHRYGELEASETRSKAMATRGSESEDKQARQTKFNEDQEEGDALVATPPQMVLDRWQEDKVMSGTRGMGWKRRRSCVKRGERGEG